MKRPRFEVLRLKVKRSIGDCPDQVTKKLNRLVKKNQRLVYLKHDTLVANWSFWTAIVENTEGRR